MIKITPFKSKKLLILIPILIISGILFWQNWQNLELQVLPLVAGSEHDVVVLEECDFAVKFPKKVTVPKEFLGDNSVKQEEIISSYNDQKAFVLELEKSGEFLTVNCSSANLQQKKVENFDKYIPNLLTKYSFKSNTNQIDAGSSFMLIQHYFIKNDKNYTIADLQREKGFSHESLSGLFDIQIQPNSLAPSTPSVKL